MTSFDREPSLPTTFTFEIKLNFNQQSIVKIKRGEILDIFREEHLFFIGPSNRVVRRIKQKLLFLLLILFTTYVRFLA